MNSVQLASFRDEMEKIAYSAARQTLELAGLGTLAVPSVQALRNKGNPDPEADAKSHAKYEIAGLGMLAAPYVKDLAVMAKNKILK